MSSSSRAVEGLALRKLQPVIIPARDGLRLNGYLTMPEAAGGTVPLVLLVRIQLVEFCFQLVVMRKSGSLFHLANDRIEGAVRMLR